MRPDYAAYVRQKSCLLPLKIPLPTRTRHKTVRGIMRRASSRFPSRPAAHRGQLVGDSLPSRGWPGLRRKRGAPVDRRLHKDLRRPAQSRVSRGGDPRRAGTAAQRECSASRHHRATAPCSVGLPHSTPRALRERLSLVPDQAATVVGDFSLGVLGAPGCWRVGSDASLREVARRAAQVSPRARLVPTLTRSEFFGAQRRLVTSRSEAPASGYAKADAMVDVAMGTNQASAVLPLVGNARPSGRAACSSRLRWPFRPYRRRQDLRGLERV